MSEEARQSWSFARRKSLVKRGNTHGVTDEETSRSTMPQGVGSSEEETSTDDTTCKRSKRMSGRGTDEMRRRTRLDRAGVSVAISLAAGRNVPIEII